MVVEDDNSNKLNEYAVLFVEGTNETIKLNRESCQDLDLEGLIVEVDLEDNPETPDFMDLVDAVPVGYADHEQKQLQATIRGARRLLIVLMDYTDARAVFNGCGQDCIRDFTWRSRFSVDSVYRQASFGAVSFPEGSGRIVTIQTGVPRATHAPNGQHNLFAIRTAAQNALRAQFNINTFDFDFVAHFSPAVTGIGVAFTPGRDSFMNSNFPDTLAHEIGHNFGKHHAGIDLRNTGATTEEYGDRSSTMGYSHETLRSFNVPHQLHTSWIPGDRVVAITDTCRGQVVTLHASSSIPTAVGQRLAATIPRDAQRTYIVSFRTAVGHDTLLRPEYVNVVSVHYLDGRGMTQLVALVRPNNNWVDIVNGYVLNVGPLNGNTIQVTFCRGANIRVPVSSTRVALNFGPASAAEDQAAAADTNGSSGSGSSSRDVAVAVVVTLLVVGVVGALALLVYRRRKSPVSSTRIPLV